VREKKFCIYHQLNTWDSWEPAEDVKDCDRLLRSFWRHIGMDNEDYSPGDKFDAEDEWISESEYMVCNLYAQSRAIGKEREYFANVWRDKAKKKKKASKDRHYAFTVRNPLSYFG
jgi:hypothetical protein